MPRNKTTFNQQSGDISLKQSNSAPSLPEKAPVQEKNLNKWLIARLAILAFLILGITGFLIHKRFRLKQQPGRVFTTPPHAPTTAFSSPSSPRPTNKSIVKWKTYISKGNIFTIKYPATWHLKVISPMTISTDPNTNDQGYFGTIEFSGPQGYLRITSGDGFGGALCSTSGGKLDTFTIGQKEVRLCHQQLEKNRHFWNGDCGDCSVIKLNNSKLTGYVFSSELKLPYDVSYSLLNQILSSFRVPK